MLAILLVAASVLWQSPYTLRDAVEACARHAHLERGETDYATVYDDPNCPDILRWERLARSPAQLAQDRAVIDSVAKAARLRYGPAPADPMHVQ